jgi:hypothetical protein
MAQSCAKQKYQGHRPEQFGCQPLRHSLGGIGVVYVFIEGLGHRDWDA